MSELPKVQAELQTTSDWSHPGRRYSGPDTNGCGEPGEKPISSDFGISEAPKGHPDNTSGTMKVIME